jgi:hypothetical protein
MAQQSGRRGRKNQMNSSCLEHAFMIWFRSANSHTGPQLHRCTIRGRTDGSIRLRALIHRESDSIRTSAIKRNRRSASSCHGGDAICGQLLRIASRTCHSIRSSIMPDLPTSLRFRHEAAASEALPPRVRSFLLESQRRVIEHCRGLLTARDLDAEHRHRLTRVVAIAETELQHLVA